jgi:NAD-dependent SIR2 family protein deacetylase
MPKVAFLLGAGASFPFGIPMMRQFYEEFVAYVLKQRAHCAPLLEKIMAGCGESPDLELLIQRLEEVRGIRSGLAALGQRAGDLAEQISLADELRGYLDSFLIETCERFDADLVKRKFSRLVEFAHNRDAYIFTTNYDRLVEVSAASRDLRCADGFEPASTRPESRWTGVFDGGVRLIKLHGSVNWYEEQESGNVFRLERGYSMPSYEYRLTHGERALRPLMIIPTLEKALMKQPYAGLMTQFSDALREISVFIVVGNSLRDDHLRNTIIQRANALDIILVNPAALSQVDVAANRAATHAVPLGIEQFLDGGLDGLGRLLDDLAIVPDAGARRSLVAAYSIEMTNLAAESMTEADLEVLEGLSSGGEDTTLQALRNLKAPVHARLLEKVRGLAAKPGDESVRVAAIDTLTEVSGTDAIRILEDIATSPGSLLVRAEAALALRSLQLSASRDAIERIRVATAGDRSMAPLFVGQN